MTPGAQDDPEVVRVGGVDLDLERLTYATVVVMSMLAVYKGWGDLSFLAAGFVIVAPVVALGVAHAFSEVVHAHAALARPLTAHEWRAAGAHQLHLLLAALPPFVVLVFVRATGFGVSNVRAFILLVGVVTLMALAAVAGRRAGYRGGGLVLTALAGGLVGLIVISLQLVVKSL